MSLPEPSPVPIDGAQPVLLEASAGTGKTYQSEGLVVRLVAEAGVPIERLLVITFTKAATADLRARVRHRLVLARDAIRAGQAPPGDRAIEGLLVGTSAQLALRTERLDLALRDFDQAPISTIHGFCQRTLEQLAFAADQEPGLDVLGEPRALREQVLADAWANLYAEARAEDLGVLADLGWTEETLDKLVKEMTGPVEPVVEPVFPEGALGATDVLRQWGDALRAFGAWLEGPEGSAAVACLRSDARIKTKAKRVVIGVAAGTFETNLKRLKAWISAGGPRNTTEVRAAFHKRDWYGDKAWRLSVWEDKKGPLATEDFAGRAVYAEYDALRVTQDELWPQPLVAFAQQVRPRFLAELRRQGLLTYDGMLSNLASRLESEGPEGPLRAAIRLRFEAAIVDEFQDTDGAQWGILRSVFVEAGHPFFAVGDPKQSIYSFRNADIDVYLQAKAGCRTERLGCNFRSDRPLVRALNHLWHGSQGENNPFDVDAIRYEPVEAHEDLRVRDLPLVAGRDRRALEIRWFDGEALGDVASKLPTKPTAERLVARLCARECRVLLAHAAARVQDSAAPGDGWRELRPGDLAVLTRKNAQAALVREELARLGIPAVSAGASSIFKSEPVSWVLAWLDAVAQPGSESPARRLAVTPLVGWTADRLARALSEAPEHRAARAEWEVLRRRLGAAAHAWPSSGFFRLLDRALGHWSSWTLLLGSMQGERAATDLRHLVELLHHEERRSRPGPRALAEWLRRRVSDAEDDDEEQARRLESDASAVQLVTVHSSKGLQYPFVFVPFDWSAWSPSDGVGPLRSTRRLEGGGSQVVLDLHNKGSAPREAVRERIGQESQREDMRLLYVATTRARHHLVLWTGAYDGSDASSTGRLLFPPDTSIRKTSGKHPEGDAQAQIDAVKARLDAICKDEGLGWSAVAESPESCPPWQARPAQGGDDTSLPTQASAWDPERRLGAAWFVASYSSLSGGKGVDLDEPAWRASELPGGFLEAPDPESPLPPDSGPVMPPWRPLLRDSALTEPAAGHDLPGGADTGNWLHAVFEHLDFQARDGQWRSRDGLSLSELVAREGRRHGVPDARWHRRIDELGPAWLRTPLDGGTAIPAGFTLEQLAVSDRVDELQFDLRLGVGSGPLPRSREPGQTGRIDPEGARLALAAALDDASFGGRSWLTFLLNRTDSERALKRVLPPIAGLLTGFIDLAFRTGGPGSSGRYWVCDYKSNQVLGPEAVREWQRGLAEQSEEASPRLRRLHYTRPLLSWAMAHSAYHLQALLYTVAIHRLLKQRLGADTYDYDRHVGGHLYLFLRGMEGADTPRGGGEQRLGVWADRWPRATVLGLDRALLGGSPDEVRAAMRARSGGAS